MDLKAYVLKKANEAKDGARAIAKASSGQKNEALIKMAEAIRKKSPTLCSGVSNRGHPCMRHSMDAQTYR